MPALPLLLACADPPAPPAAACTDCVLTDDHVYTVASTITAATTPLPPGADATISWDAFTTDLRGRPVDPATTVADAVLVLFDDLTPDEVTAAVAEDELSQDAIAGYFTCDPEGTSCRLSDFCLYHACFEPETYFAAERGTWLVLLRAAGEQGALTLQFLAPDDRATGDVAAFDDTTAALDLDVDLRGPAPLRVADGADVAVDWSGVTRDGLGHPLDLHRIDRLEVGRYDAPPADLEAGFARLDGLADATWTLDVEGADHAALADLQGDTPFPGVDAGHTWLLALRCTTCLGPLPPIVAVLEAGG